MKQVSRKEKTLNLHTDVKVIHKTNLEKQLLIKKAMIFQNEL